VKKRGDWLGILARHETASVALPLLLLVALTAATGALSRIDNLLYDLAMRTQDAPAPEDVVIVAIDERSLREL